MHLPRSNCVSWSCIARNPPAGAVQSAQWRELEVSSSRAPAEFFDVMCSARRLSHLWCSSVSGGTADGGKEHEGCAPSNSAAGESHLHHGKQVCRLLKYYGAGASHLPQSNCVSWACVARNTPPERSKPLSGENLIYQVRELRRNLLRSCAVPVGSRNFVPRP